MKPEPATEITPDHWIEPPLFAQPGEPVPDEVRTANKRAAETINAHKDNFIKLCLDCLIPDEEYGQAMLEHIDKQEDLIPKLVAALKPEKMNLTIRNVYGPTLAIPKAPSPTDKKQTAIVRQTGHTLTFNYDNRWIGTMEIEYGLDGRIGIKIATKDT